MAIVDLVMPKMGESIMEATVLKWLKNPGDKVQQDEPLLEIATDKVDSDVPSIADGILENVFFDVNDIVPIGAVIATIRTETKQPEIINTTSSPAEEAREFIHTSEYQPSNSTERPSNFKVNKFYSPLVMNIAANENVSMSELENIPGTGNEGRVTKNDILEFIEQRKQFKTQSSKIKVHNTVEIVQQDKQEVSVDNNPLPTVYSGNVEIIEMDRMRKLIADHMVRSKQTSPHVTSFSEADVTNIVLWREKVKKEFEKREGTRITFTPLFMEALVRCIKKYPLINSSLEGDKIVIKKDINLGMATALAGGNLIVPVIRNADQLNLVGLARQVNTLADNARNNKLRPEDIQDGTFTLTNIGTFGSLMGTPIINQPQVAILAVGAIKKRPVVVETPMGDSIAIRHMMYLSMSYDHRIIDGSLGSTFLTAMANELENFDPNRDY
ncbi:MAG: dihydrolipoamide acetyltransferase family protein [Chitinophagaceae bacterium]